MISLREGVPTRTLMIAVNFAESIKFLETLPDMERSSSNAPRMTLASMHKLLKLLGSPQEKTKTIHVTGSKGKGSTATFIAALLKESGYRTALFTSPHLHSYQERIAFDLLPVAEEEFAKGISRLEACLNTSSGRAVGSLSTFGILTALFFLLVAERGDVDWQIVEVGLGGKDDATNVFAKKELAVFTPISIEHAAILGNTAATIATNKAGIITRGCTVILASQPFESAAAVITDESKRQECRLIDVSKTYSATRLNTSCAEQKFRFVGQGIDQVLTTSMLGDHQILNAATAIAASQAVGASAQTIEKAIRSARLSGRFEAFALSSINGLADSLDQTIAVVDGAHNGESAQALVRTLRLNYPNQPCTFVLACNSDKNVETIWHELSQLSKTVVATRTANQRSLSPEAIAERIRNCDKTAEITIAETSSEALSKAKAIAAPQSVVCATGSLYLAAEWRSLLLAPTLSKHALV